MRMMESKNSVCVRLPSCSVRTFATAIILRIEKRPARKAWILSLFLCDILSDHKQHLFSIINIFLDQILFERWNLLQCLYARYVATLFAPCFIEFLLFHDMDIKHWFVPDISHVSDLTGNCRVVFGPTAVPCSCLFDHAQRVMCHKVRRPRSTDDPKNVLLKAPRGYSITALSQHGYEGIKKYSCRGIMT